MPTRRGKPGTHAVPDRTTRGIRLTPEQEDAVDAVQVRMGKRLGGTFSFSATVRYLLDLGLERDAFLTFGTVKGQRTPGTAMLGAVVDWAAGEGGAPEMRRTGKTVALTSESARECAERGCVIWIMDDDSMRPSLEAGDAIIVDPHRDPTHREKGLWWVDGTVLLREMREPTTGAGRVLVAHSNDYDPIVVTPGVVYLGGVHGKLAAAPSR